MSELFQPFKIFVTYFHIVMLCYIQRKMTKRDTTGGIYKELEEFRQLHRSRHTHINRQDSAAMRSVEGNTKRT
jgi:hypothetical protein